jgi:Domain of unknown function (DUF4755)
MLRGAVRVLFALLEFFLILGFSAYAGFQAKSWIVFLLVVAIGTGAAYFIDRTLNSVGRLDMTPWLASAADCKYKYAWDGYGIAVDAGNQTLHLVSRFNRKPISKSYPFSDVRRWAYEMPGFAVRAPSEAIGGGALARATHDVTSGVTTGFANSMSQISSMEKTGLYIEVRDIDFPKWFIKFQSRRAHDKKTETELVRWMEILEQTLNDR